MEVTIMKYLCLAYGDEKDWLELSTDEQETLLAQDEVLRRRGDKVAVLERPTTVTAWDGNARTTEGPYAPAPAPLVGFSLIEAADLDEAIGLVANTPCARAKGAIEVWPIGESNLP
jgi:hypothetical protein